MTDIRTGTADGENLGRDIVLWHGTSETVDTVRAEGILPRRHGAVFLTDNPELALDYAESDRERTGYDTLTLVSVRVSDLDVTKLTGDLDHTLSDDWQDSLSETDQCMHLGAIPAHVLTVEDYSDDPIQTPPGVTV